MANNFYTATEALLRAYEEIDKTHSVIEIQGVEVFRVPNRIEFYAQELGLDKPTLTQKLLSYYNSTDEVFSSKESKRDDVNVAIVKDAAATDYILDGLANKINLTDSGDIKLTDEELEETHNELFTTVNTVDSELPDFGNPFLDDSNSHNQKPLEPNEDNS